MLVVSIAWCRRDAIRDFLWATALFTAVVWDCPYLFVRHLPGSAAAAAAAAAAATTTERR